MNKQEALTVRVTIVDGSTGQTLVDDDMPAQDLPKTFLIKTTLHIGEKEWEVVDAVPPTAEEYLAKKQVKITVVKIEWRSAKDILFTLPTINDWIPNANQNALPLVTSIHSIHEDNWRQIELISLDFGYAIEDELRDIARIYSEERVDRIGFRKCFVRKRIPTPIATNISLSDIQKHLPHKSQSVGGVAYSDSQQLIQDGFSFDLGKVIIYGHQINGFVQAICLSRGHIGSVDSLDVVHSFGSLQSDYGLVLVDWCRIQIVKANKEALQVYINEVFYR